jgi:hypothetical protein
MPGFIKNVNVLVHTIENGTKKGAFFKAPFLNKK